MTLHFDVFCFASVIFHVPTAPPSLSTLDGSLNPTE